MCFVQAPDGLASPIVKPPGPLRRLRLDSGRVLEAKISVKEFPPNFNLTQTKQGVPKSRTVFKVSPLVPCL